MKQYENYKDSGVEWLGDIPSHWKCVSFKTYFKSNMGAVILQSDLDDNGTIPVYSATQENKFFGYVKNSNVILNKGDIVIPARGNSIGCIKLVNEKSTATQTTIYSKKINTINNLYVFYYLMGLKANIFYFVQTAIPQITVKEINEKKILIPPMEEQEEIVNYLDSKVTNIDKLISNKKKQAQLLKENKQAIINDVVTKGLNPNVKLKDTHMEYIGKIPTHWEIKKLKYILTLSSNKVTIKNELVIALENIESFTGKYIKTSSKYTGEGVAFNSNNILFGKLRPYLSKVVHSSYSGIAFGDILVYDTVESSKYYYYYMSSTGFIQIIDNSTYGTKMPRANPEYINNTYIILPPLAEQQEIAKYLDRKISIIDQLVEKINKSVELLEEYKISLISHVITGKRKIL